MSTKCEQELLSHSSVKASERMSQHWQDFALHERSEHNAILESGLLVGVNCGKSPSELFQVCPHVLQNVGSTKFVTENKTLQIAIDATHDSKAESN